MVISRKQLSKNSRLYITSSVTLHYTFDREFVCLTYATFLSHSQSFKQLWLSRGKSKNISTSPDYFGESIEAFRHYFGKPISIGLSLTYRFVYIWMNDKFAFWPLTIVVSTLRVSTTRKSYVNQSLEYRIATVSVIQGIFRDILIFNSR